MFLPDKPFQPSLMYAISTGAYLSGATFIYTPIHGRLLALPANVRLEWKAGAEDKHAKVFSPMVNYTCKRFYNIVPWTH